MNVGGNTAPVANIASPQAGQLWKVGDTISFSGSATDVQDGSLAASKLSWSVVLFHCDAQAQCHQHPLTSYVGVSSGTLVAPDHAYPSYLQLTLTATDSGGLTNSKVLRLDPQTTVLNFQTSPGGFNLTVGAETQTTSFSRTVIVNSANSVSALLSQTKSKQTWTFDSWSDGGAQTHFIIAPSVATTYTARYRK